MNDNLLVSAEVDFDERRFSSIVPWARPWFNSSSKAKA